MREETYIYAMVAYGTRHTLVIIDISLSRKEGVVSCRSRIRKKVQGDRYWVGDIESTRKRTRENSRGEFENMTGGEDERRKKSQIRTVERRGEEVHEEKLDRGQKEKGIKEGECLHKHATRERKGRDRNIEGGDVMNFEDRETSRTWGAKKTQLTTREENEGKM